jgi:phosphoenolpyruvate-protein kinase (PTS system EI component)
MSISLIARQKACLRSVSIEDCVKLANVALDMGSAEQVRMMMRDPATKL